MYTFGSDSITRSSYFQLVYIVLTICGFQLFSFLSSVVSSTPSSASIYYRALYAVIGLMLLMIIKLRKKDFLSGPKIFVFIFWFLYFLRALWDSFLGDFQEGEIFRFWTFSAFLCFLPMVVFSGRINVKTIMLSKSWVYISLLTINLAGLLNNISGVIEKTATRFDANELLSTISYGQAGLLLCILSVSHNGKQPNIRSFLFLLSFVIGACNIAIAASRGPLVQGLVVFIITIIANYNRIRLKRLLSFLAIILLVGYKYLNSVVNFSNVILRLKGTSLEEERTELYIKSWLNFMESPIVGHKVIREWAHNIILGSLEAMGILGGVLMMIILWYSIKKSYRLIKITELRWLGQFLIVYIIFSLTAGAIWNSVIMWPLIVLVFSLKYDMLSNIKPEENT